MADYGVTNALAQLEADLLLLWPRARFFFGEEIDREGLSQPRVIWIVERGLPQTTVYDRPETDRSCFASDMVQLKARCTGGLARPTDRDPRRVEYDLSEALVSALRWCVVRRWNGADVEEAWVVVQPVQPGNSGCPIEYTFRIRVDVNAAPAPEVPLESTEMTFTIEAS